MQSKRMKQLLTYISPEKTFNQEHQAAVKIQIDNSLSLGWKPEDIILATNFPYEYNGVKSIILPDECYCEYHWPATKIYAIVELFRQGLITDTIWYHDFDCFQLNEMRLPEFAEIGITNYGRMPRMCSASIFFKPSAAYLFEFLKIDIDSKKIDEERGLGRLMVGRDNITHLNITYAFHKFNLKNCYQIAEKPLIAAHFHLTPDKYNFFVRGQNKLGKPLIPDRLVGIFHKHGFRGNDLRILVIVRGVDESSLDDCVGKLKKDKFEVVTQYNKSSIEKKEREVFLKGAKLEATYDWLMVVDADTIITSGKKEIEALCEEMSRKEIFYFYSWLAQTWRHRVTKGVRFYRTSMCGRAFDLISGVDFSENPSRASKYICEYLEKKGFPMPEETRAGKIIGVHLWFINNKQKPRLKKYLGKYKAKKL